MGKTNWKNYEIVRRLIGGELAIGRRNAAGEITDMSHDVTKQAVYGVAAYLSGKQGEPGKCVEAKLEDGSRLVWYPAEGEKTDEQTISSRIS